MRNTFANFTGFSVNSLLQSGIEDDTGTGAWPHNCLAHYILVPFHNPFPRHLLHAVPIDTCYCTCCPHPHSLTAGLCGLEDEAKTWSHFINTMAERWGCRLWNVAWPLDRSCERRQHHYTIQWSWATECPMWLSDWPQSGSPTRC